MTWQNGDQRFEVESIHDNFDENVGDLPPAYDALSIRPSIVHDTNHSASPSTFPGLIARSGRRLSRSGSTSFKPSVSNINESQSPPPSSFNGTPPLSGNTRPVSPQQTRPRKKTSWLSLLPFVSSFSAKRVRQSILSIVGDIAVPPSRISPREQRNVQEIFASLEEACAEHELSLSSLLQETSIADHTPMYWAIVNYRQDLLVALLVHSRPLTIQTISDIRRACLVSSNQALFHALRVCRPPFHVTDGIQVPSLRAASNNLLVGNRPIDEICVQQASEQGFIISFDVPLWQKRLKVIGQVSIEFIASGRMWCVTFFSPDAISATVTSGKLKQGKNTWHLWHVMVSLLESSPATFFDSRLVVDVPPPFVPDSIQTPRLRETQSATYLPSRSRWYQSISSMYDYKYDGKTRSRSSRSHNGPASSNTDEDPASPTLKLLPPIHPLRRSPGPSSPRSSIAPPPPPVSIRLGCGDRKLGRRGKSGDPPEHAEKLTTMPDTWSDRGVGYTNAAVSPLGDGLASQLLCEHSRYLFPDGTLRGRLEARFVKSQSSKDCIIC